MFNEQQPNIDEFLKDYLNKSVLFANQIHSLTTLQLKGLLRGFLLSVSQAQKTVYQPNNEKPNPNPALSVEGDVRPDKQNATGTSS